VTRRGDTASGGPAGAEEGWHRFYVKSSGALQRDLSVYRDESFEDQVFTVVGDKHSAQIVDAWDWVGCHPVRCAEEDLLSA
jgi:hypothetical protein